MSIKHTIRTRDGQALVELIAGCAIGYKMAIDDMQKPAEGTEGKK